MHQRRLSRTDLEVARLRLRAADYGTLVDKPFAKDKPPETIKLVCVVCESVMVIPKENYDLTLRRSGGRRVLLSDRWVYFCPCCR